MRVRRKQPPEKIAAEYVAKKIDPEGFSVVKINDHIGNYY